MKKILFGFLIVSLFISVSSALTIDELFSKLQENKGKIQNLQADITTSITSNVKGMKSMEQKGHIWTKSVDKSKTEMYSPMKQITIVNGTMMAMISPDTGQKQIQDLSKVKGYEKNKNQEMDFEKAKEKFSFSMKEEKGGFIITGIPKDDNKFMGKMEVYVNSAKMAPSKINIYNPTGKLINSTSIEYKQISGVNVPYKNTSQVNLPNGSMKVEMVYENIKVNEGISDKEFAIN